MGKYGTLAATVERARLYGEKAREALTSFTASPEKQALLDVIDEQPEYDPGVPGSVTVNLPVGHYVVMCNIQGHYKNGMYADLEIVDGPAAMRLTGRVAI